MRMLNKQKVVMNVSLVHFLFTIRLDNQINVYPYICTPPYLNNDIDYYDFRHRFNLSWLVPLRASKWSEIAKVGRWRTLLPGLITGFPKT